MHKLVILIEPLDDPLKFDEYWPTFLHLAEDMPSLLRETTSHVENVIFGRQAPYLIHELYFASLADLRAAMASPVGLAAGETLQQMTGGRLSLLITDHKEDDLENIRKFRAGEQGAG